MRFFQALALALALAGPALGDPAVVETLHDRTILRSGPTTDDERLEPVAAGVRFLVAGSSGGWSRVRAGPEGDWSGWIQTADLKSADALQPARLGAIKVSEEASGAAELRFHLDSACAWQIEEQPTPGHITLFFPGARSTMLDIAYAQNGRRIGDVQVHPVAGGVRVELAVNDGLWGYASRWDQGELVLSLAAPLRAANGLRGVRVVIDPGHGGSDTGATGKHGTYEKTLNLACALALKQELESVGAVVTMTRDDDHEVAVRDDAQAKKLGADVELQARVDRAEAAHGQLFISIHHNASPDLKEGLTDHGTHAYYFSPHSHTLAESLAPPVAHAIGEPSYRAMWRSFHVIRQSTMPAVLIEVNFISNPDLEQNVETRPGYAATVGRALREGFEAYIRTNGR